jgi:hypothetical protein
MAQSCNLYYTPKDGRQTTLHDEARLRQDRKLARDLVRQAYKGVLPDHDRIAQARFHAVIADLPLRDPRREFVSGLESRLQPSDWDYVRRGIGNAHLAEEAPNLLGSLREIVAHEGRLPANLFTQGRAGHTPTLHRLAHPTYAVARGYAAEILGTGAILRKQIDGLVVGPGDQLIFGEKAQTGAGLAGEGKTLSGIGPNEAGRLVEEALRTPKSRTSESDLRISKQDGRQIGVDFKWTSKTARDLKTDEVLGALNSILMGPVNEFHFVTNARFTDGTRRAIEAINRELDLDSRKEDAKLGSAEIAHLDEHQPDWKRPDMKIVLHEKAPI